MCSSAGPTLRLREKQGLSICIGGGFPSKQGTHFQQKVENVLKVDLRKELGHLPCRLGKMTISLDEFTEVARQFEVDLADYVRRLAGWSDEGLFTIPDDRLEELFPAWAEMTIATLQKMESRPLGRDVTFDANDGPLAYLAILDSAGLNTWELFGRLFKVGVDRYGSDKLAAITPPSSARH